VLETTQGLLLGLVDAETGQRGYLLTGREDYLEPYRRGAQASRTALGRLRRLTEDNPAQRDPMNTLERLRAAKVGELQETIDVRGRDGAAAAAAIVATDRGRRLMDSIRSTIGQVNQREEQLLATRQQVQARQRRTGTTLQMVAMLAATLLALVGGLVIRRGIRTAAELHRRLSNAFDGANRNRNEVQRVNDELQVTNEELEAANEELRLANDEVLQSREAAEASRAMLHALINGTPDSVFLKDRNLRYLVVNEATARVLGRPGGQVIGRRDHELFPPEVLAWLVPQDLQIMEANRTEVIEEQLEVAGQPRWFLTTKSPWVDQRGEVIGLIGVSRDITERRETEHRLRQLGRLEAVGRLGGGVAHEVNNQMTVVLGAASFLLRNASLDPALRQDVLSVRRAAERSAAITAQLLAFSRRQLFRPQTLDLNTVVGEFAAVLHRTLHEGHTLELRLSPDPVPVTADRGQLEQVLLNLVLNAVDAMPSGGRLTIATHRVHLGEQYVQLKPDTRVKSGPYVALIVSDTGLGMDRDTLAHAFEPFYTTKPLGQGTGLGLSSVYGIVKQSGGYIWLYSELGEGTTVKMYLPETGSAPPPAEIERREVPVSSGRILIAEDDPTVRAMMVRALGEAGYLLVEATNGREALDLVTKDPSPFDLVITDVAMPQMNGRDLAQRLATARPSLPVLAVSGYTDDEIVRRGLLDDGHPFLQKPFAPEVLVARARELLERRRPGSPTQRKEPA
jgi:PAS domain S-box-containing protein